MLREWKKVKDKKWKIWPGLTFLQPTGAECIIKEMIGYNIIQILGEDTFLWSGGGDPAAQEVPGGHPAEDEDVPDLMTVAIEIHLPGEQFLGVVGDVEEEPETGHNIREHHPVDHLQPDKLKNCNFQTTLFYSIKYSMASEPDGVTVMKRWNYFIWKLESGINIITFVL